ncbi:MAG: diacylglycerol kinase family protein [Acidobacteriota bacterium]
MNNRKYSLIYNKTAGRLRHQPDLIARIQASLLGAGIEVNLEPTAAPGSATELARAAAKRGDSLVIVCGGDGTINEATQALVGTNTALAVWPGGTANVLARELKLPDQPDKLAQMIAGAKTRRISVGHAYKRETGWQRYFLLMAGVGVDAAIVRGVNPKLKRRAGVGAFWISALNYLARLPLTPFSLGMGREHYEATFACIGNAASYGGWFTLTPEANLEENKLDVCLFNSRNRTGLLRDAIRGVSGSHRKTPNVVYRKASVAFANTNDDAPVQLDGEFVGTLPMLFASIPDALSIVVPEHEATPNSRELSS